MKKQYYNMLLLLASILLLSSCTKYSFQPMDEKIIGTWNYEKVKNKPGIFKSYMDVTKNYDNQEITFGENGDVLNFNTKTSATKTGQWKITRYNSYYFDDEDQLNTQTQYVLNFNLSDTLGNNDFYVWNLSSITAKKLKAGEQIDNESYNYVLLRQ